ncbi:hypothetical protein SEPCBS119000_002250 [Sporothrix epigloea]|uniref:WW domain-containing protein n=1 Tax=Sporothrix epigloea TaxID=1892477 RepID=A0ABP0DF52_9PEZI
MAERSRGIPDAELFMGRPLDDDDIPAVQPLRINKPQNSRLSTPSPASATFGSDRYGYPSPPGSSTGTAAGVRPATRPSFSPSSNASSSAGPLPYPTESDQVIPQAAVAATTRPRPPYPDDQPPISTSASDNYIGNPPRFGASPVGGTRPGSAEHRGRTSSSLSPLSPADGGFFANPATQPTAQQRPAQQQWPAATAYPQKSYYRPPSASSTGIPAAASSPSGSGGTPASTATPARINPYRPSPVESDTHKIAVQHGNEPISSGNGVDRSNLTTSSPIVQNSYSSPLSPGGGIESHYGVAGGSAVQPPARYQSPPPVQPQQQPQASVPRPWTPTEQPGDRRHGTPTVYQGISPVSSTTPPSAVPVVNAQQAAPLPSASAVAESPPSNPITAAVPTAASNVGGANSAHHNDPVSVLEQDFQRMQASTPPPAYARVNPNNASGYPREKQQAQPTSAAAAIVTDHQSPAKVPVQAEPDLAQHPALAAFSNAPVAASNLAAAASRPGPSGQAGAQQGQQQQRPQHLSLQTQGQPQQPKLQATQPSAISASVPNHGSDNVTSSAHSGISGDTLASPVGLNGTSINGASSLPHPSTANAPAAPPPLPEGWISHLDPNSGLYYYIHMATQATQWEFPTGPTPLKHDATPLSPTASTYGNPLGFPFVSQSLASPTYPSTPGYAESIASMTTSTTAGFVGLPPNAGIDMYKISAANGVYFGPYLRYMNMDVEKGIWMGSIMIVTDNAQPPTIHIHQSLDLSPNPRQLIAHAIYTHRRWTFYKYDVDLQMGENGTDRWTYAVTSHLGCTRYEFVVAGRHEQGWRFLVHSGNDFSPLTSQADRSRLGGVDLMWKDALKKNVECGGFHVQLGLGDQISADRLWREVPLLQQWLAISGRENRKNVQWTARHEEDTMHAYFHYYTSHFDQPYLREAFAQIPHVLQVNDHDIFDGFGSYPAYMQQTAIFKNIGRIAIEMYLLFQHHTTIEILRNVHTDQDLFTITGAGWHFIKYLGPAMVVVGPDCRSERTQTRVLAGPTYQGLFPKAAMLPPSVQHCMWMMSVPIVYPRMETVETLANTLQTGKKAVNTTYNLLGKVTSSVAGVVGGKEAVQQGFTSVKKAIGKSGLMGSVLNNFGEIGITEELRDLWTHDSKDLERTYLIRTLQGIARQKGIRMTFLSGSVQCCGAGLVHDPSHPSDHKTMYQIVTSPIVGAPSSNYLMKMLHNHKLLYVPLNGHLSTNEVSDTKEDMMEIFQVDTAGQPREYKKLMNRRNYLAVVAFDPAAIAGTVHGQQGLSKLSLAVDFIVQGDGGGGYNVPRKYGPVIVPHLEFGH